jgi:REP element-mobilizing transposase RayT/CheY-like chemotaxis protein
MTARVLILSPDTGFGGLIQQTLEKTGGYEPVLATSGRQAMDIARQERFDLAILDADIGDIPADQVGSNLLDLDPELRLILIPPETPSPEFFSRQSSVSGYLTKPFYLPDLVEIVDRSLSSEPTPELIVPESEGTGYNLVEEIEPFQQTIIPDILPPPQNTLPWLDDVNRAAQLLAKLSMASDAQAGLLIKNLELWAYAGQLPQAAVQELAQLVKQGWKRNPIVDETEESHVDLARYIRLKSTGGDYLLYATMLENQMLLALAFNAKMSFSDVRSQAVSLARALNSHPEERPQPNIQEESRKNETEASWLFAPQVPQVDEEKQPQPEDSGLVDADADYAQSPAEIQDTRWIYEFAEDVEGKMGEEKGTGEDRTSGNQEGGAHQTEHGGSSVPASLAFHSPVICDLHFACVLVPRLPEHRLSGDLAQVLEGWMSRLALAYAWHLDFLEVCPTHLQWVAGVSPETSADQVIGQVRTRTSEMIFQDFPRLQADNPSGDFWAPGYLVVSSRKPLPGEVVNKFIRHTRLRQGVKDES